mgnify:FL=1|jgi:hypothetical protein
MKNHSVVWTKTAIEDLDSRIEYISIVQDETVLILLI